MATDGRAQSQEGRLRITLVADQAEAVLSILEARAAGATPTAAAWERLFTSEGWHVAATVERESSRDRLLAALCDPAALLAEYNRVAYGANQRGRNLPLWSEQLAEALRDPEADE